MCSEVGGGFAKWERRRIEVCRIVADTIRRLRAIEKKSKATGSFTRKVYRPFTQTRTSGAGKCFLILSKPFRRVLLR